MHPLARRPRRLRQRRVRSELMSRVNDIGISTAGAPPGELYETRLDIPFTIVNISTTIAACVLPFYFYSRSSIAAFLVFYTITGFGLTLGYHRLFAHRAF